MNKPVMREKRDAGSSGDKRTDGKQEAQEKVTRRATVRKMTPIKVRPRISVKEINSRRETEIDKVR